MTLQTRAAALWKYGKLYPSAFPDAVKQAAEVYRQDRIERGVKDKP